MQERPAKESIQLSLLLTQPRHLDATKSHQQQEGRITPAHSNYEEQNDNCLTHI